MPDTAAQARAAARVPLSEVTPELRNSMRQVLEQPTIFSPGPAEAFNGQPALYDWLLDHPDRALLAWRRLGARCTEIVDRGNGCFTWSDGHGSSLSWQTAYQNPTLRIWYAEGKVRPTLFLPAVPVRAVLMLRHGFRSEGSCKPLIFHQATIFLQTDGATAALATRLLGTSAPRVAEQCLGYFEMFYSGLVWYLNQHPDRADKLLAANVEPAKR
jgi:hypothetical protein